MIIPKDHELLEIIIPKNHDLLVMIIHILDLDGKSYSGLDKIQTLIWMKHHTLDLDETSYFKF